ncbi:RAD51B [Symbiodinium sp. KB8]|nr:RAD51B [Symbiodinium sp. KB8]
MAGPGEPERKAEAADAEAERKGEPRPAPVEAETKGEEKKAEEAPKEPAPAPAKPAEPAEPVKLDVISAMQPSEKSAEERMELAMDYFQPVGKKRKLAVALRGFAPELLCNTPSNLQTCRSLLLFLEKKMGTPLPKAPEVQGPEDLKSELESFAEEAGRAAAIAKPGACDARVRRVLDLSALTVSPAGKERLESTKERLQKRVQQLNLQLKERGESDVETLTKPRQVWAEGLFQRDWLAWCERLLQAREANLLRAGNQGLDHVEPQSENLTAAELVASLLGF